MPHKLIRFDWAVKKLLRDKANFDVLEGFLSELLEIDVQIEHILESGGNKQHEYDKFNRVDILVRTNKGELMLVEIQNEPEIDYFQRILYGVSKLVTEYIKEGQDYGSIKKIVSVSIVYFRLGQGKDYVYEYKAEFVGKHFQDILTPNAWQRNKYQVEKVSDILPKYYILKVNNFDDVAQNTLDEWIYFLKNSEIKDEFKAKGLKQAKEKLRIENMSEDEQKAYQRHIENKRVEKSVIETAKIEAISEVAFNLIANNVPTEVVLSSTGLSLEELEQLQQDER
jgi:predicted transposase/invertase (TIGR01784 family)